MAVFCSSAFAKHSGNNLSPIFFCILLLGFVSVLAADNICTQYKHIILKPTSTYTHCNVKVHVTYTESAPTVAYPSIENITSFNLTTIVMLSPKGKDAVHWLRTDIPKNLLVIGTSQRTDDVYRYKGPSPPEDTGVYNYQFFLLSQPLGGNISIDPYIDRNRKNFKMVDFQKANKMEVLGVFQYRTEYADSGSGRSSFPVILGIVSVVWAVFFVANG